MSSNIQNHWGRILSAPPPSLDKLASDFPDTFDTSGWGDDQEIVVTSLPPHMEPRVPAFDIPSHPNLDLSAFATPASPAHGVHHTPRRHTWHPGTFRTQKSQFILTLPSG